MEQLFAWFILLELISAILLMAFNVKLKDDKLFILPALIIGAVALASAIYKGVQSAHQSKLARQVHPNDPTYVPSQYTKDSLGLAQSMFNGRMAGASNLQQNIEGAQANTIGNINRNATSSSQALALAQQAQGQTDNEFNNLAIQEEQDKQAKAQQLYQANREMTGENEKVFQDQVRKYQGDVAAKTALRQASANNASSAIGDLASAAYAGYSAYGSASGGAGINSNIGGANVGRVGTYNSGGQPNSLYPWMSYQTQGWNAAPTGGNPNVYAGAGQPYYFDPLTGTIHR